MSGQNTEAVRYENILKNYYSELLIKKDQLPAEALESFLEELQNLEPLKGRVIDLKQAS